MQVAKPSSKRQQPQQNPVYVPKNPAVRASDQVRLCRIICILLYLYKTLCDNRIKEKHVAQKVVTLRKNVTPILFLSAFHIIHQS